MVAASYEINLVGFAEPENNPVVPVHTQAPMFFFKRK
jgi:hypothetical protein